jgi:hypothetical protein
LADWDVGVAVAPGLDVGVGVGRQVVEVVVPPVVLALVVAVVADDVASDVEPLGVRLAVGCEELPLVCDDEPVLSELPDVPDVPDVPVPVALVALPVDVVFDDSLDGYPDDSVRLVRIVVSDGDDDVMIVI